jgi:hypothetical protein
MCGDNLHSTRRVAARSKREHLRKRKQFRASLSLFNTFGLRLLAPSEGKCYFCGSSPMSAFRWSLFILIFCSRKGN